MPKAKAAYRRVFPSPACVPPDSVVIRDMANEQRTMSVTNDAEEVVRDLVACGTLQPNGQRLYYIDTDGRLDELKVDAGEFAGFKAGPPEWEGNKAP
jgi:hypothetical protein